MLKSFLIFTHSNQVLPILKFDFWMRLMFIVIFYTFLLFYMLFLFSPTLSLTAGYCLITRPAWQHHFLNNLFVSTCKTCVLLLPRITRRNVPCKRKDVNSNSFSTLPRFVRGYAAVSVSGPFMRDPLLARGRNQRAGNTPSEGSLRRILFLGLLRWACST